MPNYYALVPAAGSGSRMGSAIPKQYLPIFGKPLIYHTLSALCDYSGIARTYVVLAEGDKHWEHFGDQYFSPKMEALFCGGDTRAQSVLNGLMAMAGTVADDDWVLVHDAARPCLSRQHLDRLIQEVGGDPVGGLLAIPMADTLKRADNSGRVERTEPRDGLWRAQTPQMFRYRLLLDALSRPESASATDESQAMEWAGHHPLLVTGDNRNIKVTYAEDLEVAKMVLTAELETER
ncbi:MAG: 2-C-methyl-D-erythritol 4-phosphate cytidylyltransferase [Sulfuricellaceae bacterium]|jgi:2-C-methyl-D-erythritol 4-phosphate cytidylyltransferase